MQYHHLMLYHLFFICRWHSGPFWNWNGSGARIWTHVQNFSGARYIFVDNTLLAKFKWNLDRQDSHSGRIIQAQGVLDAHCPLVELLLDAPGGVAVGCSDYSTLCHRNCCYIITLLYHGSFSSSSSSLYPRAYNRGKIWNAVRRMMSSAYLCR